MTMYLIKTTIQTPDGLAPKYIASINEGRPSYTSKKVSAKIFSEEEADETLKSLHENFGKTFSLEPAP